MGSSGDLQETVVLQQGRRTWGPEKGEGCGRSGGGGGVLAKESTRSTGIASQESGI